jgi:hypothetical protein
MPIDRSQNIHMEILTLRRGCYLSQKQQRRLPRRRMQSGHKPGLLWPDEATEG